MFTADYNFKEHGNPPWFWSGNKQGSFGKIDLSEEEPVVIREGAGDVSLFK